MKDQRRRLQFERLSEVMPEVDRLLLGHQTLGAWSLGQILNHLSSGLILSVEGFPGRGPWLVRKLIGPMVARRILKTGRMREGVKLPRQFEPKPGLDARAEAEALRAAIQLFGGHLGPFAAHPILGPFDRESWERFHAIHAAHHLGFVLPVTAGTPD